MKTPNDQLLEFYYRRVESLESKIKQLQNLVSKGGAKGKEFQFLAKGEFKKSVGDLVDYKVTNEEYKTAKLEYNPLPTVNNTSKDQLIIRQSMVKAACEFHSSRPQSDIHTVLADSQLLIDFINK